MPEKGIFQPLHNDKKSVLSIKESFSMEKRPNIFTNAYGQAGEDDPPLAVSLTVKRRVLFLTTSLREAMKNLFFQNQCIKGVPPKPPPFTELFF